MYVRAYVRRCRYVPVSVPVRVPVPVPVPVPVLVPVPVPVLMYTKHIRAWTYITWHTFLPWLRPRSGLELLQTAARPDSRVLLQGP